jgi:hypothetical protein
MPLLRQAARDKVDVSFNAIAAASVHRDSAHIAKRAAAQRLLAGQPETSLDDEAVLRGLAPAALAQIIVDKPDDLADRENRRQRAFSLIGQAATPRALDDIVANLQNI